MKAIKWYDLGAYHGALSIVLGQKAYLKEYKRLTGFDEDTGANYNAYAFVADLEDQGGHHTMVVYFNPKCLDIKLPENLAGLAAHEATHVAQFKWKRWGEDEPGMEAEAHLIQYITAKLYRFLRKRIKPDESNSG